MFGCEEMLCSLHVVLKSWGTQSDESCSTAATSTPTCWLSGERAAAGKVPCRCKTVGSASYWLGWRNGDGRQSLCRLNDDWWKNDACVTGIAFNGIFLELIDNLLADASLKFVNETKLDSWTFHWYSAGWFEFGGCWSFFFWNIRSTDDFVNETKLSSLTFFSAGKRIFLLKTMGSLHHQAILLRDHQFFVNEFKLNSLTKMRRLRK